MSSRAIEDGISVSTSSLPCPWGDSPDRHSSLCNGSVWYLPKGALKTTSQDCHLPQSGLRAPLGRIMQWMKAPRTFHTLSRMTPLKRWASSLKPPLLRGALCSPHLTWRQPSATGSSLKMTHHGAAPHHLTRKQVSREGS